MSGRFWRNIILSLLILLLLVIGVISYVVGKSSAEYIYSDINKIPKNRVGLLLGTAKFMDKGKQILNEYYQNRIDATVALYMAGKIDYIIVSGDNSTFYYNEPALMRQDLIDKGVPPNRIFMDYAGFRTLDSILRCRDVFGQNSVTIISQNFHNERAIFIANHKKVKAVAYNAADGNSIFDWYFREKMARVKMMMDLLFNTQAKYYGEAIEIK